MESVLNFLSSSLFSNILAIMGIAIALLPQKDTVSISHSTNYYFETNVTKSSTNSTEAAALLGLLSFLATYILYAFLQPYFSVFLLIISVAVIIRYRFLKIAYLNQMIFPAILVIMSAFLNYFLPKEVTEYWNNAYKIDLNQIDTLSKVLNQLTVPLVELKNVLFSLISNPLSVAIFSNMLFVFLATTSMVSDLFRPKHKIKVVKVRNLIPVVVILLIIISFMFYTVPASPARIVIDSISRFLSN